MILVENASRYEVTVKRQVYVPFGNRRRLGD